MSWHIEKLVFKMGATFILKDVNPGSINHFLFFYRESINKIIQAKFICQACYKIHGLLQNLDIYGSFSNLIKIHLPKPFLLFLLELRICSKTIFVIWILKIRIWVIDLIQRLLFCKIIQILMILKDKLILWKTPMYMLIENRR
jgi:hypothetical protein